MTKLKRSAYFWASPKSVLGFDFDGAWRAGGAQQEARDMVAEADHALLDRLARAGKR